MISLKLPLAVKPDGLERTQETKKSIDDFIRLLMTSAKYSFKADPNFGFIFNNLSFENFNEVEGVISNTSTDNYDLESEAGLYDKKISGSSKNFNTFASDLKSDIITYERRLQKVSVTMSYVRIERQIYIEVKGKIVGSNEDYNYKTIIKVWN